MSDRQVLFSEEDIRTKVVYTWLADHEFTPENISVEFSFEIRLGRGIYSVGSNSPHSPIFRPRADVLVRSSDGRNLIIVEVKAPHEKIDDDAKQQGISYARLLKAGGIAPFVIITNGNETQIFDSITEESLEGSHIPTKHQYAQNGFRVCVDDIALRSETLRKFISLSFENLLAFCNSQVSHRMSFLKSNELFSGSKYIPQLYVERKEEKRHLRQLLRERKCQSVIVFGHPQVGKTNFICHFIEDSLKGSHPCLFYPAIGMRKGVLEEICDDFAWDLYGASSNHEIIRSIANLLAKNQKKLVIFIDGWNEANEFVSKAIDMDSLRLIENHFQLVVSITANSAKRLLFDDVGNPSNIAIESLLTSHSIPLLEGNSKLLAPNCSVLEINKYEQRETEEAYQIYSQAYEVKIPYGHEFVNDPFLLRIAMEHYAKSEFPISLDENSLQEKSIRTKIRRAKGISEDDAIVLLTELAKDMAENGSPVSQLRTREIWRISAAEQIPEGFLESALLVKVRSDNGFPSLDFYYERERSFIVSNWIMRWQETLPASFLNSWSNSSISGLSIVKLEALEWFLRRKSSISYLKELAVNIDSLSDKALWIKILSSIRQNSECWINSNRVWVDKVVDISIQDTETDVRVEAVKLFLLLKKDSDRVKDLLSDEDDREKFVRALLETDAEYSFRVGGIGQVVLEALKETHFEFCDGTMGDSISNIVDILENILLGKIRSIKEPAAKALGYIAPEPFFQNLHTIILTPSANKDFAKDFADGIDLALHTLRDHYHGYLCPGIIEGLRDSPSEHVEHYLEVRKLYMPIINFFWPMPCAQRLLDFLNSISPSEHVLALHLSESDESDYRKWMSKFKQKDPNIIQLELFDIAFSSLMRYTLCFLKFSEKQS